MRFCGRFEDESGRPRGLHVEVRLEKGAAIDAQLEAEEKVSLEQWRACIDYYHRFKNPSFLSASMSI